MAISRRKKIFFVFSGILFILVVFSFGFFTGKSQVICSVCKPEDVDFSLFWETWNVLKENFFEPQRFDTQKMIEGAISGMVKSLGDPYTIFFNPKDTKDFFEEAKGTFEGIGIEIDKKKDDLLVISPLEGTPAEKAGLRAGDKILKIGDKETIDLTLEEAVQLIRGPKETEVTLTISREGWEKPKEFKIVRTVIKVPSLKWELKDGDIAYLKLYQFFDRTADDFRSTAIEIINSPAKKIILDLRNNPGGYLEVAQEVAGWFLKNGDVVVIEDFGPGKEKNEYKVEGNEKFLDYPIVVLINQGSASASEILAGALRDNRNILLIGEKSFGKGSIQELKELRGGSTLKVTIAKWLTPKGQLITDKGLEPDIGVEMTEKDYEEGKDPQLEKAIEVIKNL
jgi:carboxyl-terminal processing protease